MHISRYQKLGVNWDEIQADLSVIPYFYEFKPDIHNLSQCFTLSMVPWHKLVPYPMMLRVENNDIAIFRMINGSREKEGKAPIPGMSMRTGSYSASRDVIFMDIRVFFDIGKYCEANGIDFGVIDDPSEVPELRLSGHNVLCRIMHHYEEEPVIVEYIRKAPGLMNSLFSAVGLMDGIQVGVKRCLRCGEKIYVERTGTYPMKETATKWKRIDKARYDSVLGMPLIHY